MKYLTKEWYRLKIDQALLYHPIPDKDYSDEEIQILYEKKRKKYIREEKKVYNSPPFFLDLNYGEIDLEDILIVNEETGEMHHPTSREEAIACHEENVKQAMRDFENREPFDEEEYGKSFDEEYENKMLYSPFDDVDPRLVGLDYLPKSFYDQLKKQDKINGKIWQKAFDLCLKNTEKVEFGWHDGRVLSFQKTLKVETEEGEQVTVSFEDLEILENEIEKDDVWLYDEVYREGEGYEIHVLTTGDDLHYLTLRCKQFKIKVQS